MKTDFTALLKEMTTESGNPSKTVVCSLRTEAFKASSGYYGLQKQIYFLKSICKGSEEFVEEDIASCGIEDMMSRIINLWKVPDGRYILEMRDVIYRTCEGHSTEYVEDWNYELFPYKH